MPETVMEYFASRIQKGEGARNVLVISYGLFPSDGDALTSFERWPYAMELLRLCWQAIKELNDIPFNGAATCALVMDMATKRFWTKHGFTFSGGRNGHWSHPDKNLDVPKIWKAALYDVQCKARCERRGIL